MTIKNKVTFGLEQVHIAFEQEDGKWDVPKALPGAVSFTPSADGSQTNFDADNIVYYTVNSNNGYTADLTIALIPDWFLQEALGWSKDKNGAIVEIADAKPKRFALLHQVEGDQKSRRVVHYSCLANRPAKEDKTNGESIEINPDILSLKIMPVVISGKKLIKTQLELSETNSVAYEGFFKTVYVPQFEGEE